jgi:hypothetical protein
VPASSTTKLGELGYPLNSAASSNQTTDLSTVRHITRVYGREQASEQGRVDRRDDDMVKSIGIVSHKDELGCKPEVLIP